MKLKILPDLLSFLMLHKILFKVNYEKTTFEDGQHITLATVKKAGHLQGKDLISWIHFEC